MVSCFVDGGDLLAYGSKDGVHLPDLRAGSSGMLMCLLALPDVKQVNVLLECGLLVLLSGEGRWVHPQHPSNRLFFPQNGPS